MREVLRNKPGSCAFNIVQFESPSHTGTLLTGLNTLRNKSLLLDVTLIAGGRAFRAHKVVLASCSEYFRAMFTDAMKESKLDEICLNGVTAEGMKYLLDYAYTSRLSLSLANIQDVLSAANHVQFWEVVEACSSYLQEQLDLDNCVDIATISELYFLRELQKRVYSFMCGNLQKFSQTMEFQRLSIHQLNHLLKCDYPVDCPEIDVLQTVLQWLEYYPADRMKYAHQLLSNVYFSEIPSQDLREVMGQPVMTFLFTHSIIGKVLQTCISNRQFEVYDPDKLSLVNSRGMELALLKVGGFGISGVTNEITYYLPSLGKWRYLTSIPHVEQCNYGTVVLNNELFVVGGCFNQSLQENVHPFGFHYNPLTNSWSTMAPMQKERCRFSLNVVNEFLYAIGGSGELGEVDVLEESAPCEKYDPVSDVWTPVVPLTGGRAQHAGAAWNDFLYIAGGLDQDIVLDTLVCYDTHTERWENKTSMLTPRADHGMVCYKNKLYVCGGWYEDETTGSRILVESIDRYDVKQDNWHVVTHVPTPRYHAGIGVIGPWLYIVGGFHSATTFDRASGVVECYNLDTGIWTIGEHYPQDIWEHTCCTLHVPKCRDDLEVIPDKHLL